MVISKFYVQEKKLIILGHAGQSVENEKGKKKVQTAYLRKAVVNG